MTIKEAASWLDSHDNYLILTHRRPDGDTLGCAAALAAGLNEHGKTAFILYNPEITERYNSIVGMFWAADDFVPDHIITVDIAAVDLFPVGGEKYSENVSLCIDHHPSNTGYSKNTCLVSSCASCGEIVYELLMELGDGISDITAAALYIALSTDTGCFAYTNTTGNTLRVASLLADAGAPIAYINKKFFRTKTKSRILLEGMIISGLEFYLDNAVAISSISLDMLNATGADEQDMEDIASIPGVIEGVVIGITIRELGVRKCKFSVRSTARANSNELCAKFGGGGHAMAAGCTIEKPLAEAKKLFLEAINQKYPDGHI